MVEMNACFDAAVEVVEIQKLIRRMRIFVREPESQKHRVKTEDFFELHNYRYRSTLALIQHLLAESLFQRRDSGFDAGTVDRCNRRLPTVQIPDFQLNRLRSNFLEMHFEQLCNFV